MIEVKVSEYSKTKYLAFLSDELIEQLNVAVIYNEKYIKVEESIITKLIEDVKNQKIKNDRINNCAKLNNVGTAFEKSGETLKAIEAYEKNIIDEYPATHSYDRLIKIYRRLKRHKDELRVLNLAIRAFSKENERRFEKVKSDPKNGKYLADLQIAHETCTGFKSDEGWFIYVPYPIMNYIEQIAKCEAC